jgi:hypothetical protein
VNKGKGNAKRDARLPACLTPTKLGNDTMKVRFVQIISPRAHKGGEIFAAFVRFRQFLRMKKLSVYETSL